MILILRRLEQIQQRSAVILEIGLASRAQPILQLLQQDGELELIEYSVTVAVDVAQTGRGRIVMLR